MKLEFHYSLIYFNVELLSCTDSSSLLKLSRVVRELSEDVSKNFF